MFKHWKLSLLVLAALAMPFATQAQTKPAPAPKRDLTGIWEPVRALDGIQPSGARDMPADGKPQHELPYTPYGREMASKNKTSNGPNQVPSSEENDPGHMCDPLGFPRANLFELRATQYLQTPQQLIMLYTFDKTWRTIWSDGRALPKDPDPHWYGYSVGKWTDDYTFVVQTVGTDDRTWVDNAGRPHSEEMKIEEVFHRIDHDNMELTMTLDDPKVYTKPWVALNKLPLRLKPATFEMVDMMCSPSELEAYNKRHAERGAKKK
ncbi:MAG: hypothetical protein ABL995_17265 [Bryobacteraceae bacterium]